MYFVSYITAALFFIFFYIHIKEYAPKVLSRAESKLACQVMETAVTWSVRTPNSWQPHCLYTFSHIIGKKKSYLHTVEQLIFSTLLYNIISSSHGCVAMH